MVHLQELGSNGGHGDRAEHAAGVGQGVADDGIGGQLWVGAFQHVDDGRHTWCGSQCGREGAGGRGGLHAEDRHQQPRHAHQADEQHHDEEDHAPAALAEVGEEGMSSRQADGVDEDGQAELEDDRG